MGWFRAEDASLPASPPRCGEPMRIIAPLPDYELGQRVSW